MTTYWTPIWKHEYLDWFVRYYKGKYTRRQLNRKTRHQLKGWYHKIRSKEG